ncbi:Protein disulfide-isomerase A3, partial [Globomyces sp. JEL0801]
MKISIIYFLFWLKVWGLTDDEISDAADKAIEHVKHEEVEDLIANSNTLILFFGASWCPNTKRFNPKYLKVQELVKEHKLEEKGFRMRKVECTEGTGKYCQTDHHVRGYPTMKVYANGVSKREYQYSHDTESLFGYIQTLIEQHPLKDPEVLKKEQQIQELVDQKEQLEKNVQFIDLEFKSKQATLNSIEEKL